MHKSLLVLIDFGGDLLGEVNPLPSVLAQSSVFSICASLKINTMAASDGKGTIQYYASVRVLHRKMVSLGNLSGS